MDVDAAEFYILLFDWLLEFRIQKMCLGVDVKTLQSTARLYCQYTAANVKAK